ncbi:MAG: hypothetical protein HQM13_08600 [SAR324 cluster bacterium]|nr:hypothetical protein [SAR324 cluster bacterium]
MLKVLMFFLVFFPNDGQAFFDRIVQDDLLNSLHALNEPLLENRFAATQELLRFPQWSLPLIRNAIQDPNFEPIHWRLAYLLSMLGTQNDIPLLLKSASRAGSSYREKIWKGAAERLFWRHRRSNSKKYIISRLRFLPDQRQGDLILGKLLFKIVNPDNEGRLIHPRFDFWHVRLTGFLPMPYYWIEAKSDLEVELPLSFSAISGRKTLRIDMKVTEVGKIDGFIIRYPLKVPLPPKKNSG